MIDSLFLFVAAAGGAGEELGTVASLARQFGVDWRFLIAQIVNFCLVAFILYRFAFKPVLNTIEDRQKRIADGLQYAEEMKSKLEEAEKKEVNDPNALSLATANKSGTPSVRIVLLKDVNEEGFVFYTNLESQKSKEIYENPNGKHLRMYFQYTHEICIHRFQDFLFQS